MASDRDSLKELVVTRAEYMEHGASYAIRKFSGQGRIR